MSTFKRMCAVVLSMAMMFGIVSTIGVVIFLMVLPNKPSGTVDTIELDEVLIFTEDELENRLIGELRENIIHSWGNPHSILNGQDTVAYELPNGDKYKSITLFYEDNIIVNIVLE